MCAAPVDLDACGGTFLFYTPFIVAIGIISHVPTRQKACSSLCKSFAKLCVCGGRVRCVGLVGLVGQKTIFFQKIFDFVKKSVMLIVVFLSVSLSIDCGACRKTFLFYAPFVITIVVIGEMPARQKACSSLCNPLQEVTFLKKI